MTAGLPLVVCLPFAACKRSAKVECRYDIDCDGICQTDSDCDDPAQYHCE